MSLSRRRFVTTTVLGAAAVAATARAAASPAAALYTQNAAPLAPAAFLRLPPGAVTAQGWLAGQLQLQLNGLCGRYQDTSHFLDYSTTGWVTPANTGWEEVPYWLRGYGDLAYVTGDATALSATERWINGILATQQSDGFFGPASLRTSLNSRPDFWPYLPLLQALRSYAEFSGDSRIVPALTKFFQYMNAQPGSVFASSWSPTASPTPSTASTGSSTAPATPTCSPSPTASTATAPTGPPASPPRTTSTSPRASANLPCTPCAPRTPPSPRRRTATTRPSWGPTASSPAAASPGDENYRAGHTDPRHGFEVCGIVEFMASHEALTRLTGDPVWADRCEDLAFNSLPASLDPQGRGVHYVTSANGVDLDLSNTPKTQGQFDNSFAMQAYMAGVTSTAAARTTTAWLALVHRGTLARHPRRGPGRRDVRPCEVTAKVADGTAVTVAETPATPSPTP